jgi:hypothetical protein
LGGATIRFSCCGCILGGYEDGAVAGSRDWWWFSDSRIVVVVVSDPRHAPKIWFLIGFGFAPDSGSLDFHAFNLLGQIGTFV